MELDLLGCRGGRLCEARNDEGATVAWTRLLSGVGSEPCDHEWLCKLQPSLTPHVRDI
jgi:hypothetical protein